MAADVANSRHSIASPGSASDFAYQYEQVDEAFTDNYFSPASVNQDLIVMVGPPYTLSFQTFFDKCTQAEGFVGVMLNHQPVYTVDACELGPGAFKQNTVAFVPSVSPFNLRFEFVIGEYYALVKIDNVVVVSDGW